MKPVSGLCVSLQHARDHAAPADQRLESLDQIRRMAGLFAFFYGTLHLRVGHRRSFGRPRVSNAVVAWTTLTGLASAVWEYLQEPYSQPVTAWGTMVPLTITSTAGMIRRLGGKHWTRLHRVVYATAALGAVHYWWLVKADIRRPLAYAAVISLLLTFRVYWKWAHAVPAAVRRAPLVQSATGARKAS